MSKMKILLLCPYPEGVAPGQRLKYEQYFSYLRENGFEIDVSPFFSLATWSILYGKGRLFAKISGVFRGYLRRLADLWRAGEYDGVYIFLHVAPLGDSLLERCFRWRARKVVYDIDDLVFLRKSSQENSWTRLFKGVGKYNYLMRTADHIITCTPYLDEYARQWNKATTDISSTIDTHKYIPPRRYEQNSKYVLGWSGSHSTAEYLHLLKRVLPEVAKHYPIKLHAVGAKDFAIAGIEVNVIPWSEATEVSELQKFDVGLYPLPKEQWVLGKSGLKALQYMALGIPTVATAIGANFRVIENGVSGFLVDDEKEWIDVILRLLENPRLRQSVGEQARARVEKYFSIDANRDTYLSIFQSVYGNEKVSSNHRL